MGVPKGGIAFFDSGIGGLTVLAECQKVLPNEFFYYLGDNAHAPYGNLPENMIRKYTFRAFKRFKKLQVKAVVIACNTVTAVCVEELRRKYSFPIIGVEPALYLACRETQGEIFALVTLATYKSVRIKRLVERCGEAYPNTKVHLCPCEHLAAEIEHHITQVNYSYLPFLPQGKPNAVVLGCTHYIYIKEYIQNFYGCLCYDGNKGIARRLYDELCRNNSGETGKKNKNSEKNDLNWDEQPLNRDERPPEKKSGCFWRFFMSKFVIFHKLKKRHKTNKCLHYLKKVSKQKAENKRGVAIFFLGKRKKYNEQIYKQMFVF